MQVLFKKFANTFPSIIIDKELLYMDSFNNFMSLTTMVTTLKLDERNSIYPNKVVECMIGLFDEDMQDDITKTNIGAMMEKSAINRALIIVGQHIFRRRVLLNMPVFRINYEGTLWLSCLQLKSNFLLKHMKVYDFRKIPKLFQLCDNVDLLLHDVVVFVE